MDSLLNLLAGLQVGRESRPPRDVKMTDDSEEIQVSPLALIKMLKHANAGVPFEVMGLMLGDYVDEYTVRVIDVFSMPQKASSVSVESVDDIFQSKMMDMLSETGRPEKVVGWYHSHPGMGCFLSGTDMNTHASFEQLNVRSVAVVIDPIQSVRGSVVMDAFRNVDMKAMMAGAGTSRQTTSNLGHIYKPTTIAIINGLGRYFYGLPITVRIGQLERQMLRKLRRKNWSNGLHLQNYKDHCATNQQTMGRILELTKLYKKGLQEDEEHHALLVKTAEDGKNQTTIEKAKSRAKVEQFALKYVGKQDPKRHIEVVVNEALNSNIVQLLGGMISKAVFKRTEGLPK